VVTKTEMLPPYPNPFNPSATVAFTLVKPGRSDVRVYDLRGRLIRVLAEGHFDVGRHEVTWHGKDNAGRRVASGVYFVRMQAGGVDQIKRMVLVK
jgi:flagellar hook assembly protein FlgD